MFDPKYVSLGIAPIGWCNDDMPELGGENTFQQTVSEMALAGFTGCEIGNKYPTDPAELKKALDLRGMRIASRWYSSFILTRPMEEEIADFTANLDFLAAVGANRLNVSEQSYSIQGKMDTPILTGGHKHVMTDEEWDRIFDTSVKGAFYCSRRAAKAMIHRHEGGVILNLSSMWGQVGASCETAYSAAKGALISFTKALAKELGPSGIRVNCAAPGVIMTDMNRELDEETLAGLKEETPLERLGTPRDIANLLYFLASDEASFITGQVIGANGGLVIT